MKQQNYYRYFRVFKNDTVITEISVNDFIPVKAKHHSRTSKYIPASESFFYGYLDHAKAREMAKTGAIAHINTLIAMGKDGELALFEYRFHHYQDLTVNLVGTTINHPYDLNN